MFPKPGMEIKREHIPHAEQPSWKLYLGIESRSKKEEEKAITNIKKISDKTLLSLSGNNPLTEGYRQIYNPLWVCRTTYRHIHR